MLNDDMVNKLTNFIMLFDDKTFLMARYMLDNKILNDDFIKLLSNSDKFNNPIRLPFFNNISDVIPYYHSLLDDFDNVGDSKEDVLIKLNSRLDEYIRKDMFEEAIRLRDYMKKNNIDRIIK